MPYNSFDDYPMSWRPVLPGGSEPLAQSLARLLEEDIRSGALRPGTQLPPQRELADFLDISVSTVSRAFGICSRKGLLSGQVGSGTYVAYNLTTDLLAGSEKGPSLIEMGSMMPETIAQQETADLLRQMMSEIGFGRFSQYFHGTPPWQQEAAAALLRQTGCPVNPADVRFASGGQNALAAIFAGLLGPGARLGVDPLVYTGVKGAANLFGVQLVPIPQEQGEMSEEGIARAVKNEGISALYLMPDSQNPTAHRMSAAGRSMIARSAKQWDLLVIEDAITSLLQERKSRSIFADAPEQTIFILSLSKSVDPSLRLAYLAVPERFQKALDDALYHIDLAQSALSMELAYRLIVSGRLEQLLARRREGVRRRNAVADRLLEGYPLLGGPLSLARWLVLPAGMTGAGFEKAALQKGVAVYGAERFAVGRQLPQGGARLAVCAPDTPQQLEQALAALREILDHC